MAFPLRSRGSNCSALLANCTSGMPQALQMRSASLSPLACLSLWGRGACTQRWLSMREVIYGAILPYTINQIASWMLIRIPGRALSAFCRAGSI